MAVIVEQEGDIKYNRVKCCNCDATLKYSNLDENERFIGGRYSELPRVEGFVKCPLCDGDVVTWSQTCEGLIDNRIK